MDDAAVRPLRGFFVAVALGLTGAAMWAVVQGHATLDRAHRTATQRSAAPPDGRPEEFTTSAACRSCHPAEYEQWHHSFHRTMTQRPTPDSVQGRFDGQPIAVGDGWVRPVRDQGGFAVDDGTRRARVVLVTGSHNMQVYWTRDSSDGAMRSVPIAWLIPEARWVPNEATLLRPPHPGTRYTWNRVCIKCHAVAGQPGFDAATGTVKTRVAEYGIACEACHGPGSRHVALNRDPVRRYTLHTDDGPDGSVVQPADLDPGRGSEVCGQCHGISVFTDESTWLQQGLAYRSGDALERWARVVRHPLNADQPWMDTLLERDPDFYQGRFWPDGMVRVSGREYNAMIESGCHTDGGLACTDCHQLHGSDPVDQLSAVGRTDAACRGCHSDLDPGSHSHHAPSWAVDCYDCHMPHTTYGLLKAIRSHQISVPTTTESREVGRPNACNACHIDRTLGWTQRWLHTWYGTDPGTSNPAGSDVPGAIGALAAAPDVAAVAVWALSGDAGQRALAAWHLGWSSAHRAAGSSWTAPYLVHLLDDPYDAVRIVAHRALGRIPNFGPVATDPLAPPDDRTRTLKLDRARATELIRHADPRPAILVGVDGRLDRSRFESLAGRRDDTPIELAE